MFTYYRLIYEEANPKTAIICSSISGIRARVAMGLSKGYYSFMSISDYFDDSAEMDRFLCYIGSNHDEPEALAEELLNDVRVIMGLKGDNRKSGYVQKMRELRRKLHCLSPQQADSLRIYLNTFKPKIEDFSIFIAITAALISACAIAISLETLLNNNSSSKAPVVILGVVELLCIVLLSIVIIGYARTKYWDYNLLLDLLSTETQKISEQSGAFI